MFRPFRPAFENLEKREVFSAIHGIAPIDHPRTDINDLVKAALESQSSAITVNPATLPNGYLKAALDSGPSAINRRIGPEIHDLKAAPDSEPSAVLGIGTIWSSNLKAASGSQPYPILVDFTSAGLRPNGSTLIRVDTTNMTDALSADSRSHDQALLGRGNGTFQSQVMHEEEHADDVNNLTAQAHDAVFAQMGRTGGGFLGLEWEHPSILKGLLIP